jgi:hypothetical protein
MGARVAEPGRGLAADQDTDGSVDDRIRRPNAREHIADSGRGQGLNQDGWTSWRDNRPTDMRDHARHHRADVHIGEASGRKSHVVMVVTV